MSKGVIAHDTALNPCPNITTVMRAYDFGVRASILFFFAIFLSHFIMCNLWARHRVSVLDSNDRREKFVTALSSKKEKCFEALQNCTAAKRVAHVPPATADEYIRTGLAMRIAEKVKEEMKEIHWNKSLDDLLPRRGGVPLQTLVVGHWRSGSSFVGDLLQSQPGTFYVFEPLMYLLKLEQVRRGPLINQSNSALEAIFGCRFRDLGDKFLKLNTNWLFGNSRLLRDCSELVDVCSDVEFLEKTCRYFPVQVIKTVRYRLDALTGLLQQRSNLKAVYLVRDPRAIITSRLKLNWCVVRAPDCANATALCEDLTREFYIAQDLEAKFPDRILRYESLVMDYTGVTHQLFQFLGLEVTFRTVDFLRTHTSASDTDPMSTYRDGKSIMYWMEELALNRSLLEHIQGACVDAMRLWGYETLRTHSLSSIKIE